MALRPIPLDTGRAWVAALGAAGANGVAFGTDYTFGTFFESMAEKFGSERGSTALLFGVTLFVGLASSASIEVRSRYSPLPSSSG
jgi:hypothetical protein